MLELRFAHVDLRPNRAPTIQVRRYELNPEIRIVAVVSLVSRAKGPTLTFMAGPQSQDTFILLPVSG